MSVQETGNKDTVSPYISVVLPAYNCAPYLQEAIESVLQQTFTNFELIVVNDGSIDETEKIIQSFTDSRIVSVKNDGNKGLIYTLNRGIDLARGKYIARMDGDDICNRYRLEKQLTFFSTHLGAKVLATIVDLIDEKNKPLKPWAEDVNHVTPKEIYNFLPINNCIAHPSVMIQADLLKKYRYNPAQKLSEDYDLWLRLSADNVKIYKLAEPLLYHRILKNSFTRSAGKNVFFKIMNVKLRFCIEQLRKGTLTIFVLKTFFSAPIDLLKGTIWSLKRSFQ
jgi:glycosyltransferase involved in cell wall biosynthesis